MCGRAAGSLWAFIRLRAGHAGRGRRTLDARQAGGALRGGGLRGRVRGCRGLGLRPFGRGRGARARRLRGGRRGGRLRLRRLRAPPLGIGT